MKKTPKNLIWHITGAIAILTVINFVALFESPKINSETWQKYTNEKLRFSIDHPTSWKAMESSKSSIVGFQPPWLGGNTVQWAVIVMEEGETTFKDVIAKMGSQYPRTRAETTEKVVLNGRTGFHVIVTAAENPTWRHEQIIIRNFDRMFVITNGEIENDNFELFWRSLRFLYPTKKAVPENIK
jgi:hypothetical protein